MLPPLQRPEIGVTLPAITRMIYHFGRTENYPGVEEVYDRMIEHNLQPDEPLNELLIHVCNIDPREVLLTTSRMQSAKQSKRKTAARLRGRRNGPTDLLVAAPLVGPERPDDFFLGSQ